MLMKTRRDGQSSHFLHSSLDLVLGKRSDGDNVSPNTNLNLSQELVTNHTRHGSSEFV